MTRRSAYRILCRAAGRYGVHRGMTALSRDEWRALSLPMRQAAQRIVKP